MAIPRDYFERVYAAWLGKLIGIRSGAPIEGWTYEMIQNVYGELDGYPVDYKNFAADDDSNGPIFFVRALEDCHSLEDFSEQDVADALLNYAPYEHGFFWWGGYGVSTEHTAYLNLVHGIPAPRSGSIAQNGRTVAEQIGGQIFIDPWGLVAPGDPDLAARLSRMAASVTHDGNAVYGGIFIAVCISLAFTDLSIREILEAALNYIPDDCEYARVVQAVMTFHAENPENWRDCYSYIFENYGYDRYPGACHIIPNCAVMILSLLYGNGDFTDTINMINMCGWDTDCNAGNVGCIMGAHCGLEAIDRHKWLDPINDLIINSSAVPSLNIMDAPYVASYLARQAYRLAGEEPPERWQTYLNQDIETCHFEYPGSTHAMRLRSDAVGNIVNDDSDAYSGQRCLRINWVRVAPGTSNYVYKQTHYRNFDFSDSRYDPSFAPVAYPGQTIELAVKIPATEGYEVVGQLYALNGATGEEYRSEPRANSGEWELLNYRIPSGIDGYISEVGLVTSVRSGSFEPRDITAYLDDLRVTGAADYVIDFGKNGEDLWNGIHREINQFSRYKGLAYLSGDALHLSSSDRGEIYSGHHGWDQYRITVELTPLLGSTHLVLGRVQGANRSYAFGFAGENKAVILKNDAGYVPLAEVDFPWQAGHQYQMDVCLDGETLTLLIDGEKILQAEDQDYQTGGFGFGVLEGGHMAVENVRIS